MRADHTEPRRNQQIADDSQPWEIDRTQRGAEELANRAPEPDSPGHVPTRGDRATDVPED